MELKSDTVWRVQTKSGKLVVALIFCSCLAISLWFTPLPDVPEEPCDRPCHELEWPRICRLEFLLESHRLSDRNCDVDDQCDKNDSQYPANELLVVNRKISAPTIHVCVHDILLINVVNRIADRGVSIHWRGQTLRNDPLMDGVSMVSQCPINSFTTFQYRLRTSDVGTHSWHLHSEKADNNYIHGLLVVRQSVRQDPHQSLVDQDYSSHTIMLKSVSNKHRSFILINGKNPQEAGQEIEFNVTKGERFRFRVAYFGSSVKCAIRSSIEKHTLLIIALDGNPIETIKTTSFTIVQGERLDFVVTADQMSGIYNMKYEFVNCSLKSDSAAKVVYVEDRNDKKKIKKKIKIDRPEWPMKQPFSTLFSDDCGESMTCLEDLTSVPSESTISALQGDAQKIFFLAYGYKKVKLDQLEGVYEVPQINNRTFLYPASPLGSQISDVAKDNWCTVDEKPRVCSDTNVCYCTHVYDVDVGTLVDVVLIHEEKVPRREHIFHLHGHKFHVLGRQTSKKKISVGKEHGLKSNGKSVIKDTVIVPRNGSAVIRFLADNVGYWLFEEEDAGTRGMQIAFNVIGQKYDIPEKFPQCGNWIGPKYFMA